VDTHTDHTSLDDDHSDADSDAENAKDAGDRAFISPSEPHQHHVHDNNNTNTNTTPKEEEEEQEQVQIMEQIASFDAVTLWEHDALPHTTENYFARGVAEWVSFAEAVSFSFFLSAFLRFSVVLWGWWWWFCRVGAGCQGGCVLGLVVWDCLLRVVVGGCVRYGALLIGLCGLDAFL